MRIAFFTETFLPVNDGVGHFLEALAGALERQGHRVTIHTSRPRGTPAQEVRPSGARVVRHLSISVPYYPQYQLAVLPLPGLLRRGFGSSFDIVHLHTPFVLGTSGLLAARAHGLPTVGTFHTHIADMQASFPRTPMTRFFFRLGIWMQSGMYWRCDQTTVSTPEAKQQLLGGSGKDYRRPIRIVPLGVDADRFRPGLTDPDWRLRLGAGSKPLVTFLGRLTRDKGIYEFLHALSGIPGSIPFQGVLGGTGVEAAGVAERIASDPDLKDRVRVLGSVAEREKAALLSQTRVFVLPSRADTSSVATLEAMASGAACVVTNRGGPRALVRDGENAVLVDPEDAGAICDAVARLLTDPSLADRLSRGARAYVEENASIDRTARAFVEIYESCRTGVGSHAGEGVRVAQPARTT